MKMIQEMWNLLAGRMDFFGGLLLSICRSPFCHRNRHCGGGLAGILISEYSRLAKPTLGVVNFLYTIPSISMLGFPDSLLRRRERHGGHRFDGVCAASHGTEYPHRNIQH